MSVRMVLRSSDSKSLHTNNKPWDFRIRLPRLLPLTIEWTVELTEISISKVIEDTFQNEIYIYCSICDESIVGEKVLPLLRRVYISNTGNTIFLKPYRIPIRFTDLTDIHIYIKDRKDKDASFLFGELTVTLLFRPGK